MVILELAPMPYQPLTNSMSAVAVSNGTDTIQPLHGSGMPLTEYSANPASVHSENSNAAASVPPEFLLPDGHPDVCCLYSQTA